MSGEPSVTVAIPTLNEKRHIEACLDAVLAQSYRRVVEILVVDGGSTDGTQALASRHPGVQVLHNPRRIQAAGLNIALKEAKGEVFVRIDGHCSIAPDYVKRCVDTLAQTGAAMVGGCQMPAKGGTTCQRGIAAALEARFGGGPANFRQGNYAGWSDTVYMGAMWTKVALEVGAYDERRVTNEDAELALRLQGAGGVWLDPAVRSTYKPRDSLRSLGLQYYRYGVGRASTIISHPESVRPRQVAAPALLVGLVSPWRRWVAVAYAVGLLASSIPVARQDRRAWLTFLAAVPVMHGAWGGGFWAGIAGHQHRRGVTGQAATTMVKAGS